MKTLKLVFILAIVVGLAAGLLVQPGTLVQADDNNGLVAYWPFDDGANPTDDAAHVATTLDGDLEGGASYTGTKAPVPGNVTAMDTTSGGYVEIDDADSLDIAKGSWGLWINADATGTPMNPMSKSNAYWIHNYRSWRNPGQS